MAKRRDDLFKRLTSLFRGGPAIKRKVKAFRSPSASTAAEVFKKSYSQVYSNALNAYGQYDRMSSHMTTRVILPGSEGSLTLQELAEKYPNGEKFIVYAYDHEKGHIVPAWAHHPRQTGVKPTVKVTFDDGSSYICTPDHECMMRDGSYRNAEDLKPGDSMMPFYRKQFNGASKDDGKKFYGYRSVYTCGPMEGSWHNWMSEHRMIAEWSQDRKLDVGNEHVHHKDHDPENNDPENLEFVDAKEHLSEHGKIGALVWKNDREKIMAGIQRAWDEDDGSRRAGVAEVNRRPDVREKRKQHWLKNNPSHDPDIVKRAALNRSHPSVCDLTLERVFNNALEIEKLTLQKLSDKLSCPAYSLGRWIRTQAGYPNWKTFKKEVVANNHKVVSVEPYGVEPVGDLTVDGFENFATDTIFTHNSRYADFCFAGDTLVYTLKGVFTIKELAENKDLTRHKVFAYDHEHKKIVIADAHSARLARDGEKQDLVRVTFDDGGSLTTTLDHKWLLRDGSYVEARKLEPGTALMPCYVKDVAGDGYQSVYTMDREKAKGGWERLHRIVAEYYTGPIPEDHHVHHVDFNKKNNGIENLRVMSCDEHHKYHAQINNVNKFGKPSQAHSRWMYENNPDKRDDITFDVILTVAIELDFCRRRVMELLSVDANVINRRLRERGFKNWVDFASKRDVIQDFLTHQSIVSETRSPGIDEILAKAPDCQSLYELCSVLCCTTNAVNRRLRSCGYGSWTELKTGKKYEGGKRGPAADPKLYQKVCDAYRKGMTQHELTAAVGSTKSKVLTSINNEGFKCYSEWTKSYNNHKVVSIEFVEPELVYNLTVEKYHNFAAGSVNPRNDGTRDLSLVITKNSEMEYCLSGDTRIAMFDGYKTIEELSKEYGPEDTFYVYAYDHEKGQIVPTLGKQARQTRVDHSWKVTFDSGKEIIGTANHRLMKRDGTYCKIEDLKPGDAMMPFYRRSWYGEGKGTDEGDGYRFVYTVGDGWHREHKIIAEWAAGRSLEENEVVHHKNFVKCDNRPENLDIMDKHTHHSFHAKILNGAKWSSDNQEWIDKFKKQHSVWMKKNNPAERKDITFGRILESCESGGFNLYSLCEKFDTDPNVIKRKLRRQGFDNFETFACAYCPGWKNNGWDNRGEKNPRFDASVTFQMVCDAYEKGMTAATLCETLGVTYAKVRNRIQAAGYKSFADFKRNYNNHKVVSIEYHGVIPLYDLTVDGYKNFATDTVISHNTPEIASALDIFSEESSSTDDKGGVLHVYSENEKIKELLDELFHDTLNIDYNLTPWTRNLVKYGDFFLFVDVHPELGVVNAFPMPVSEVEREEGWDPEDPLAVRFRWVTQGNQILEAWQVAHFRLMGNDAFLPYGSSILESARRIWRQLILIEDAMLVYRVVRSPERRVFYIDVGTVPTEEIPNYMEAAQSKLKRSQVIDKSTGRVDLRYNPLSVDEDYFIPVRGSETGTKIDTLAGGQHVSDIADVEYIQKKLFSALKVPKAYLGYDEALSSKSTLAQEDIRFSRSITKIQRVLISELEKLAIIHLYAHGYEGEDLADFSLFLSNPSTIAQQQKLELYRTKFEIAGTVPEGLVDRAYIRKNILMLSDDEIDEIETGRREDRMIDLELEAEELEGNVPGGGGGGPMGGGMPGEDLGDEEEEGEPGEVGGGEGPEGPGGVPGEEPEEGGEDDEDLFAGEKKDDEGLLQDEDGPLGQLSLDDSLATIGKKRRRRRKGPVKKTDQLRRYAFNRGRKRTHGPSKTDMPDFANITSFDPDPIGRKFFGGSKFSEGRLRESLVDDDVLRLLGRKRRISTEMKRVLASLGQRIDSIRAARVVKDVQVLTELDDGEIDIVLDNDVPSDVLVESGNLDLGESLEGFDASAQDELAFDIEVEDD